LNPSGSSINSFDYGLKNILINDNVVNAYDIQHRYHIVAGSFTTYQHALNMQKKLITEHFQSEILRSTDGKFRVTYCKFEYAEEAISRLKEIKDKENTSAWIIKQ
jgi:hypothetical protein